jgi:hypothetical protein
MDDLTTVALGDLRRLGALVVLACWYFVVLKIVTRRREPVSPDLSATSSGGAAECSDEPGSCGDGGGDCGGGGDGGGSCE